MKLAITQMIRPHALRARVWGDEDGQDMVEYGLLGALVSVVAIAIILLIGPYIDNMFRDVLHAFI